ncbi:FAD-dependent thymidylate synthase [Deltaproteobacteria bacterium TL4]
MKTHEQFSDEERDLLTPYVTNTDQSIFVLTHLPEVIKGALFSRYSRSTLGLRSLLLKEFIQNQESEFHALQGENAKSPSSPQNVALAIERAQNFYDRILDGYGDDSIGELGGAHLAMENVSILATKVIEDLRIGGSPLEKSTRYVTFSKKVEGDYLFYKDPKLLQSAHKDAYLEINRFLFDTYTEFLEPVREHVQKLMPRGEGVSEAAYSRSVKAKGFDLIRGLLPASTLTNMGAFGNGRFWESLISKLNISALSELNEIGNTAFGELSKVIPSFIRRAHPEHRHFQSFRKHEQLTKQLLTRFCEDHIQDTPRKVTDPVQLIDFDHNAETRILSTLLYPHTELPLNQLQEMLKHWSEEDKDALIQNTIDLRETRRHKPGRSLETVFYTFDILGDYGMYRDLQRHRMLTQERQLLSTRFGYVTPDEVEDAGLGSRYHEAMRRAAEVYEHIAQSHPEEAQYVVPLAYNIRWLVHINLRALTWLVELRSTPQGHEGYRKVAQEMYRAVALVHPHLSKYLKFVDLNEYTLGRLKAEMKQEDKNNRELV